MRILALDQGTSSSRAVIFDDDGGVVADAQQLFDCTFPRDGWVEQNPDDLWRTTIESARRALESAKLEPGAIDAIGITNQRETTLIWDRKTGEPVYPAIVWQDRRTAAFCERMRSDGMADELRARTGLVIDPYFSATKIAWILEHVDGARARAERGELCFGTVDTYLIWRLTGGRSHCTDASNASRTQLFDLVASDWSADLLDYFGIPRALLPDVVDSAGHFGDTDPQWLGAAVPVCGVAGDQQAALIGQACLEPGMAKCTFGTGCFAMLNTGSEPVPSATNLLSTVAYRLGGHTTYATEGSVFVAGVAVKWLRDKLNLIDTAEETEALARLAGLEAGGVYVVPAFTGLGAPYWDAAARGLVCGLTLDTDRADIVGATLLSVAYQACDLVGAMRDDGCVLSEIRVDGGMVANDYFCQAVADLSDQRVLRPRYAETTVLGAAILAAVGTGAFPDLRTASAWWRAGRTFGPVIDDERRARLLSGWADAVRRARSLR